jgi:FAD/FMN-containing dehydrogenase
VLGGAVARVPADATAYAHRDSRIMVNIAAFYDGPADREVRAAWVDEVTATLHQGYDGAYVNFLADEGPERIRAAYPGSTWDRLAAVKAAYDPQNVFRLNQNVPPAESTGSIGQQTRRSRPVSRS